jgi:hypothetical protein
MTWTLRTSAIAATVFSTSTGDVVSSYPLTPVVCPAKRSLGGHTAQRNEPRANRPVRPTAISVSAIFVGARNSFVPRLRLEPAPLVRPKTIKEKRFSEHMSTAWI